MADSSRNILFALLAVGLAVAVFYMMDPSLGGLLGAREGFQDAMGPTAMMPMAPTMAAPQEPVLPAASQNPPSVSGMQVEKFASGPEQVASDKKQIDGLLAASEALQKAMENAKKNGGPAAKSEGFMNYKKKPEAFQGANGDKLMEGFQNPASTPFPEAAQPANCYPKNQLAPQELLPADPNSKWAQVNPTGEGDIAGKNFLSAGALIGVNTVGQSLRNANQQLRSEPPCPQMPVSIWNNSTIEPDLQRRPLEGF